MEYEFRETGYHSFTKLMYMYMRGTFIRTSPGMVVRGLPSGDPRYGHSSIFPDQNPHRFWLIIRGVNGVQNITSLHHPDAPIQEVTHSRPFVRLRNASGNHLSVADMIPCGHTALADRRGDFRAVQVS